MPRVNANGVAIYVETRGDPAGRPLLLLRGLGSQIVHWPPSLLARLVERGFFAITPDNRDAGLSQTFDDAGGEGEAPYRLDDIARDHIGVLDALSIARAHVLGISMGGMVAQIVAARWPRRTLTLASIMSSSGAPGLPRAAPHLRQLLLAEPPAGGRAQAIAFTLQCDRAWGSPGFPFDEERRAELIGRAFDRCWSPQGTKRQYAAILASGPRTGLLEAISAPTLVIHGRDDPLLPIEHGRDTAGRIPGAELVEIAGMGHDLEGELGAMIADLVADHADAHGG